MVSSTNTAQTNFQYVCDIYIDDDAGPLTFAGLGYLREKTHVDPIYTSGVFNISRKIESFLSYDIGNSTANGFQKSANSIVQVICKFGEEYGPSSGVVVYPDLTVATTIRAWNGSMNFTQFKDYIKSDYVGSTDSTTRKWLTDRPSSGVVRTGEDAWLYALVEDTNGAVSYSLFTYDSSGVLIGGENNTAVGLPGLGTVGGYMIRIPAGASNLTTQFGPTPFVNAVRYKIYTKNDSGIQDRKDQWFTIDDTCTNHDVYRLHFLNKLGGFDSFSFIRAHTEETAITSREKYKRNLTTRDTGGSYGYKKRDTSDVNFYTRHKDTIKVLSDWISESTFTWLEELVTSPVVYHDDPTHGLLAVNITDTRHLRKQWVTDGLSNLEITFTYSHDNYRQRL